MFSRIALLLITLFWLTMNFLLWRSEFGSRDRAGGMVPVEVVWKKILTAPDNSSLEIIHDGKRAGYCRWAASAGQRKNLEGDNSEKKAGGPGGYRLDFDGNVSVSDASDHVHFDFSLLLAANQAWQESSLRLNSRDGFLSVHSVAADKNIRLQSGSGGERADRVITFAELQNPQALAREFGLPAPLELFGIEGLPGAPGSASLSPGLHWEARTDWIAIGHASVRAYRLQAKLFDRYQVVVMVSTVGEILRVELPGGWTLASEQLTAL